MDFVADQLVNGTRFRALTILDVFTREALAIRAGQKLRADHVLEECDRLAAQRGDPVRIFVDNGSEFSGRLFDLWAYRHGVRIDFSRPGKPTDNCFVETFNGSYRDECLNVHWFETIDEARMESEAWRVEYKESRPHQALGEMTPMAFALLTRHSEHEPSSSTAENQPWKWSGFSKRFKEAILSRISWSENLRAGHTNAQAWPWAESPPASDYLSPR